MVMPTVEQFFNQTFTVIKDEWKKLLFVVLFVSLLNAILAVPNTTSSPYMLFYILLSLLVTGLTYVLVYKLMGDRILLKKSTTKDQLIETTKTRLWPTITAYLAQQLVIILIMALIGLAIAIVAGAFLGEFFLDAIATNGASLSEAPALGKLIPAGILAFIIGVVGLIFLVKQSILISLTSAIAVISNKGWFHAVRESRKLVRGNWWAIFGRLLLIGLIVGLSVSIVIGIITVASVPFIESGETYQNNFIFSFITIALSLLVSLPSMAAIMVLYTNLSKKEGAVRVVKVVKKKAPAKKTSAKKVAVKKKSSTKKATKKKTSKKK